jgi:hypothetical protein
MCTIFYIYFYCLSSTVNTLLVRYAVCKDVEFFFFTCNDRAAMGRGYSSNIYQRKETGYNHTRITCMFFSKLMGLLKSVRKSLNDDIPTHV